MLPGERIAWFPASDAGSRRLAVERRVLRLIADRCSFQVPRPLCLSEDGLDIRQIVPGRCDPWDLYHRCKLDTALAQDIGRSIGTMLAEQHSRIDPSEVAEWLPSRVVWPEASDWIAERLPRVVDDENLVSQSLRVLQRYEAVPVEAKDRVLIHGDVGLHNLALDPVTDTVRGIFDYDSAAWADRHHDFRYLLFDEKREDMLEAALAVYEPAVGHTLDRGRIRLYNAACAISYLAFRSGTPPEEKSCGRTLAEDVRWVRTALAGLSQRN